MERNKKFRTFITEQKQNARCKGLPFHTMIALPVQRIPRYELLLKTILENTSKLDPERKNLESAFDKIKGITVGVEGSKKLRDQEDLLIKIFGFSGGRKYPRSLSAKSADYEPVLGVPDPERIIIPSRRFLYQCKALYAQKKLSRANGSGAGGAGAPAVLALDSSCAMFAQIYVLSDAFVVAQQTGKGRIFRELVPLHFFVSASVSSSPSVPSAQAYSSASSLLMLSSPIPSSSSASASSSSSASSSGVQMSSSSNRDVNEISVVLLLPASFSTRRPGGSHQMSKFLHTTDEDVEEAWMTSQTLQMEDYAAQLREEEGKGGKKKNRKERKRRNERGRRSSEQISDDENESESEEEEDDEESYYSNSYMDYDDDDSFESDEDEQIAKRRSRRSPLPRAWQKSPQNRRGKSRRRSRSASDGASSEGVEPFIRYTYTFHIDSNEDAFELKQQIDSVGADLREKRAQIALFSQSTQQPKEKTEDAAASRLQGFTSSSSSSSSQIPLSQQPVASEEAQRALGDLIRSLKANESRFVKAMDILIKCFVEPSKRLVERRQKEAEKRKAAEMKKAKQKSKVQGKSKANAASGAFSSSGSASGGGGAFDTEDISFSGSTPDGHTNSITSAGYPTELDASAVALLFREIPDIHRNHTQLLQLIEDEEKARKAKMMNEPSAMKRKSSSKLFSFHKSSHSSASPLSSSSSSSSSHNRVGIGGVFLQFVPFLKMLSSYLARRPERQELLESITATDVEFRQIVAGAEAKGAAHDEGVTLEQLLEMPLFRLAIYSAHIAAMYQCAERRREARQTETRRDSLESIATVSSVSAAAQGFGGEEPEDEKSERECLALASQQLSQVAFDIDEKVRRSEAQQTLHSICLWAQCTSAEKERILQPSRYFVCEVAATEIGVSRTMAEPFEIRLAEERSRGRIVTVGVGESRDVDGDEGWGENYEQECRSSSSSMQASLLLSAKSTVMSLEQALKLRQEKIGKRRLMEVTDDDASNEQSGELVIDPTSSAFTSSSSSHSSSSSSSSRNTATSQTTSQSMTPSLRKEALHSLSTQFPYPLSHFALTPHQLAWKRWSDKRRRQRCRRIEKDTILTKQGVPVWLIVANDCLLVFEMQSRGERMGIRHAVDLRKVESVEAEAVAINLGEERERLFEAEESEGGSCADEDSMAGSAVVGREQPNSHRHRHTHSRSNSKLRFRHLRSKRRELIKEKVVALVLRIALFQKRDSQTKESAVNSLPPPTSPTSSSSSKAFPPFVEDSLWLSFAFDSAEALSQFRSQFLRTIDECIHR
ncbi:uncharacterized protein MONOS_6289 [Monocercomonoides exilis]|uniref:uncharacterized protein n=1 Tax=Monocercomonoides exilis TaxID=2049356 RepID=UPI00355A6288|nr:hypothetical protein MONOS_6289 [Monocercomonoides exilis]|eukprot:MONOS_6289.1-p1 / transcript=MONOS_6289.1 / gene=MONOS_6289 / organism=Monocercomonoides_exilis_PA203 / gene_product=unspecified product / transcript_product=unspecified product / location=Mono_scaffold00196:17209-21066(+) / protein_length=1285 / sequence_SO=supercontig / SO=protein_coding / is_pseudo=false